MKPFALSIVALCLLSASLSAQKFTWQPSPGLTQIPIWPGPAPDPQPVPGPEFAKSTGQHDLVAGKPWIEVENVTRPTITVYPPTGNYTDAAVVVFPGGGYQILAIDLEGSEVCDGLTPKGITCILVKYRVTDVGPYPKSGPYPESPMALEDAQRTLGRCACTPPNTVSIPTRSACSASPQAVISLPPSARILTSAYIRSSMPPTSKAAAPTLHCLFIPAICPLPQRNRTLSKVQRSLQFLLRRLPMELLL
jgi:hypothetical protein